MASADIEFKLKILRTAPTLGFLAERDLRELAAFGKVVAYERGKPIADAGSGRGLLFIVDAGVVAELYRQEATGRALLITLHGPGSVAGIAAALARLRNKDMRDDPARGDYVFEALTNVSGISIQSADFLRVVRKTPDGGLEVARAIAAAHDTLAGAYTQSKFGTLEMRLATVFARFAALVRANDWHPVIDIGHISQKAVAEMLGVSREHINRTLMMWERSGIIFQDRRGHILVQNIDRLSKLAESGARGSAVERHEDWLWEIDAHFDRGLNRGAMLLALEALRRAPKDARYAHRAVLASARLGGATEALKQIEQYKLEHNQQDEEIACLRPRLLRDLAFEKADGAPDMERLAASAHEYEKVFRNARGYYSGVNAAAGYALIGQSEKSQEIALEVWEILTQQSLEDDSGSEMYWPRTTRAECKLLRGDRAAAATLFEAANNASDATPGKKATTRKQLRRLSAPLGLEGEWIDRVVPQKSVLYFSGPLASASQDSLERDADALLAALKKLHPAHDVGWAYGALASGADIVIAEALLEAGVELNVYLPVDPDAFLRSSVAISGPVWREKFINCLRAASAVEWNHSATGDCCASYRLGAEITMGKAIMRAAELETRAIGVFALQRERKSEPSLSIANARLWEAGGRQAIEIPGDWPALRGDHAAAPAATVYYALVLHADRPTSPPPHVAAIADLFIASPSNGAHIFLFLTRENALSAAASLLNQNQEGWSLWLDAGVFSQSDLDATSGAPAHRLITAACLPNTEPGKLYASEAFACSALLSPAASAGFAYVGFIPTREKRAPCPLYLVRS